MNSQIKDAHKARFKAAYENSTAWWTGKPQPVLVEHISREPLKSPVLDIGCGTGDLSVWLASKGYEVLGIDYVPKAIELARKKAKESNSTATFAVQDFFSLEESDDYRAGFNTIVDSGFFHAISIENRSMAVKILHTLLKPGAKYYMLNYSWQYQGPGDTIPYIRDLLTALRVCKNRASHFIRKKDWDRSGPYPLIQRDVYRLFRNWSVIFVREASMTTQGFSPKWPTGFSQDSPALFCCLQKQMTD